MHYISLWLYEYLGFWSLPFQNLKSNNVTINVNLEGGESQEKAGDLNLKQIFGSVLPQGHYWSKDNKFPGPLQLRLAVKCVSLKEATHKLFEKTGSVYFNSCCQNAPAKCHITNITKECFPPTQFNEFAAVKQANLLAFKLRQNICIMQSYWIRV